MLRKQTCATSPPLPIILSIRLPKNLHLEPLLLNLRLRRRNGLGRVRIDKAAARLAVLVRSRLGRADAHVGGTNVRAAGRLAVGVADAAASSELLACCVANIARTGVVGGQGKGGGRNWETC
jgi:hypothetical protein